LARCTGRFVCRFADRADGGSLIGFLEELRKRFGRILACLDSAGYRKSVAVKKYPDDHEAASYLDTFPVYAGAQPSGDTVAQDPQGHRQQAAWEYGGDEGVNLCNAG